MPYEIETKDGIVIAGIPDNIKPDDPTIKAKVNAARANLRQAEFAKNGASGGQLMQGGIDPTEGNSFLQNMAIGGGKALSDTALGIRQLASKIGIGNEQQIQQEVDRRKQQDTPIMNTGGGVTGNVLANIGMAVAPGSALTLAPKASGAVAAGRYLLSAPSTIGGALTQGAQGAVLAGMQPVASDESRLQNVGTGALGGAAVPVAGMALKGVKAAVEPLYEGGRAQILARALRSAAGPNADDAMRSMAQAKELVPGSLPTAAETANSPGIAAMQRAASAVSPEEYGNRAIQQNLARSLAVRGIAGDEAAMSAAVSARKAATSPLYAAVTKSTAEADPTRVVNLIDRMAKQNPANKQLVTSLNEVRESLFESYPAQQRAADGWKELTGTLGKRMSDADFQSVGAARTVLDRVRKGTIDAEEGLAQLKGMSATSKTGADAISFARDQLKTPDFVLRQNPQHLSSAVDNLKTMLGNQDNAFIKRELTTIKQSLAHQISKASPEYGQAEKTFAQMSEPINRMQVGKALADKLEPALMRGSQSPTRMNANAFADALAKGDATAKTATGFKNAKIAKILSADDIKSLNAVKDDLARGAFANDAGRGSGSDTIQKLAMTNLMERSGLPTGLANFPAIGRAGNWVYSQTDDLMRERLAKALLDPKETAKLMQAGVTSPQIKALAKALKSGGTNLALGGATTLVNAKEQ